MKRNQQKRLRLLPGRRVNGSKPEKTPRKPPGWTRDEELDRSINAAVQDGDYYSRER